MSKKKRTDKDRARDKAYRESHKEEIAAYQHDYYLSHKEELMARNIAWNKKNRVRANASSLEHYRKRKYGLSKEDFESILKKQGGSCATCGGTIPQTRALSLDHNHKTGAIRGILCHHCNSALGLIKENPAILINMVRYIIGHAGMIAMPKETDPDVVELVRAVMSKVKGGGHVASKG